MEPIVYKLGKKKQSKRVWEQRKKEKRNPNICSHNKYEWVRLTY